MQTKLINIVMGIVSIFICWAAGDFLEKQWSLPVPGAVLGLVILFAAFTVSPKFVAFVSPAGTLLLRNFPLFLFPIGAGFLTLSGISIVDLFKIATTILVSLLISLTLCAYVFQRLRQHDK